MSTIVSTAVVPGKPSKPDKDGMVRIVFALPDMKLEGEGPPVAISPELARTMMASLVSPIRDCIDHETPFILVFMLDEAPNVYARLITQPIPLDDPDKAARAVCKEANDHMVINARSPSEKHAYIVANHTAGKMSLVTTV